MLHNKFLVITIYSIENIEKKPCIKFSGLSFSLFYLEFCFILFHNNFFSGNSQNAFPQNENVELLNIES